MSEEFIRQLKEIMTGVASDERIIAFLEGHAPEQVTEEELFQAARLMRDFAVPFSVNLDNLVDTCGTGGDGKESFNLSTAAAFVAAGAGVRVAKHGNRAVSSRSGSADVLEKAGARIDVEPVVMRQALNESGVAFFYAPRYHPAMKHVAGARRKLARKTLFNILGPLCNPAAPVFQVVGVYRKELMKKMAGALLRLGSQHTLAVCGEDGLDEVTLTGKTHVVELKEGKVTEWVLDPVEHGLEYCKPEALRGGDAGRNALLLKGVLEGFEGPLRIATVLNAALALLATGRALHLAEGIHLAEKSIDTGEAFSRLKKFIEVTNR